MKTTIVGYPRIGAKRELKFAIEQYFKNEISQDELLNVAKDLRHTHWLKQKEAAIDLIPCNDFSFYDQVLDQATLLNIIPKRYKDLNLSQLDTYFAMARGYQGEQGDVRALAMKKWYNTNYHYIVPEIDDQTEIKLVGTKPFDEYQEAKELGITPKLVIIGAFTLLKLCHYLGSKQAQDFVDAFIQAYKSIIAKANELKIEYIQFDEPSLVQDLTQEDLELFKHIYQEILASNSNSKIFLQTYFGDVRDLYVELQKLPFYGIGLDFIEGKETLNLIEKFKFAPNQILVAGLINGKNIWKNDYAQTLKLISNLKKIVKEDQLIISSSCSLLHVPYTLNNEEKLNELQKSHFAFAEEKLLELKDLSTLASLEDYSKEQSFIKNQQAIKTDRNANNQEVRDLLSKLTKHDYIRTPARAERQKLQKDLFNLPLFPTTTIGSFPQEKEVKQNRSLFKKGQISEEQYISFNQNKIKECIKLQEELDLDVLVHGEYERNDMVEYFGESLGGFVFTQNAWVQSYGTRCVKPPIIWGDVYRIKPITTAWSTYAQSLTSKIVKGMLTGPVTILNWSFPREDLSIKDSISQIALAIRDEVLDLEKNGIKIIQIDEAALREKLPLRKSDWFKEYLDFAIPAFRLTHSKVKPTTQIHTHMCYSEFTDIIPAIDQMDADVITFEASRSNLEILDSLREHNFETEVGPGVYDIHSPRIPSVDEIKRAVQIMLTKIDRNKLWINPDCGLKTRGVKETVASLKNLVEAAKELRRIAKLVNDATDQ